MVGRIFQKKMNQPYLKAHEQAGLVQRTTVIGTRINSEVPCMPYWGLYFFFYFLFLLCWGALLGFKLRDSGFLNRHSTTSATPPALFCIGYFQDRVSQTICSGRPRAAILPISGSRIARHEPLAPGNISFLIQEFRWWAGYWWLTPIILAIWEAETGRTIVWGQPRETVLQTPSPK
jgi:hypothetical protein